MAALRSFSGTLTLSVVQDPGEGHPLVLYVFFRQCPIPDNQQILRILFLNRLGEIEAPRNDSLPIDDHEFVMRNGMNGVDP